MINNFLAVRFQNSTTNNITRGKVSFQGQSNPLFQNRLDQVSFTGSSISKSAESLMNFVNNLDISNVSKDPEGKYQNAKQALNQARELDQNASKMEKILPMISDEAKEVITEEIRDTLRKSEETYKEALFLSKQETTECYEKNSDYKSLDSSTLTLLQSFEGVLGKNTTYINRNEYLPVQNYSVQDFEKLQELHRTFKNDLFVELKSSK